MRIVGKVYNLCRVKTNRLAVLTVKSGLDPRMIIELEDDLNRCFIYDVDDGYFICLFMDNGIKLHVVNAC